jgi:phage-related tail protein
MYYCKNGHIGGPLGMHMLCKNFGALHEAIRKLQKAQRASRDGSYERHKKALDNILVTSSKVTDIHVEKASEMFGVPAKEVTPEMRRSAKVMNFIDLYGGAKS